ncbi:MAG: extracellular solute-binding protein, partial [Clostridia bacterium]|nr:extracellular solute-binding protein [Clostridia bacterium]
WWAQYDGEEKVKEFFDMEEVEVYDRRTGLEEGLKLFRELICTGEGVPKNSLPGAMSQNHVRMQNAFVLGKAAMLVGVYGLQNETAKLVSEDSVLKMFYTPFIDGAKTDEQGNPIKIMITDGQDFMFIPKASKNKDLAKKFLCWISTNEMCRAYTRYTSFAAPYKYNTDNIEGISALAQCMIDETKDIVMVGHIFSENPIVNQLRLLVWGSNSSPYDKMVLNNITPREALQGASDFAKGQWSNLQREFFGA